MSNTRNTEEMETFFMMESPYQDKVNELMVQVMAAELNLTLFANRHGKDSTEYQRALNDFGTAWYLLKKNRDSNEFVREVVAS